MNEKIKKEYESLRKDILNRIKKISERYSKKLNEKNLHKLTVLSNIMTLLNKSKEQGLSQEDWDNLQKIRQFYHLDVKHHIDHTKNFIKRLKEIDSKKSGNNIQLGEQKTSAPDPFIACCNKIQEEWNKKTALNAKSEAEISPEIGYLFKNVLQEKKLDRFVELLSLRDSVIQKYQESSREFVSIVKKYYDESLSLNAKFSPSTYQSFHLYNFERCMPKTWQLFCLAKGHSAESIVEYLIEKRSGEIIQEFSSYQSDQEKERCLTALLKHSFPFEIILKEVAKKDTYNYTLVQWLKKYATNKNVPRNTLINSIFEKVDAVLKADSNFDAHVAHVATMRSLKEGGTFDNNTERRYASEEGRFEGERNRTKDELRAILRSPENNGAKSEKEIKEEGPVAPIPTAVSKASIANSSSALPKQGFLAKQEPNVTTTEITTAEAETVVIHSGQTATA